MTANGEIADPFGTLKQALWICGGQWAGKSTVARLLARRHGITVYHYDSHDARAHQAHRVRNGLPAADPDPENVWADTTPERMAADTIAGSRCGSNGRWMICARWSPAARSSPRAGGCARTWSRHSWIHRGG